MDRMYPMCFWTFQNWGLGYGPRGAWFQLFYTRLDLIVSCSTTVPGQGYFGSRPGVDPKRVHCGKFALGHI
jgi:hypothetical protein